MLTDSEIDYILHPFLFLIEIFDFCLMTYLLHNKIEVEVRDGNRTKTGWALFIFMVLPKKLVVRYFSSRP